MPKFSPPTTPPPVDVSGPTGDDTAPDSDDMTPQTADDLVAAIQSMIQQFMDKQSGGGPGPGAGSPIPKLHPPTGGGMTSGPGATGATGAFGATS